MDSACPFYDFVSGPKVEVVSVPQDDLEPDLLKFLLGHRFDCRLSSHRHKNWCFDSSMRQFKNPPPRPAFRAFRYYAEFDDFFSEITIIPAILYHHSQPDVSRERA